MLLDVCASFCIFARHVSGRNFLCVDGEIVAAASATNSVSCIQAVCANSAQVELCLQHNNCVMTIMRSSASKQHERDYNFCMV